MKTNKCRWIVFKSRKQIDIKSQQYFFRLSVACLRNCYLIFKYWPPILAEVGVFHRHKFVFFLYCKSQLNSQVDDWHKLSWHPFRPYERWAETYHFYILHQRTLIPTIISIINSRSSPFQHGDDLECIIFLAWWVWCKWCTINMHHLYTSLIISMHQVGRKSGRSQLSRPKQ